MITWGRYYWPYAMILVSVMFAVPETIAIVTNDANTLSSYSWDELHVMNGHIPVNTIAWYGSLAVWLAFTVVITAHIWFRSFA